MQVWISDHYTFPLITGGIFRSLNSIATYTIGDALMLVQLGQIVEPFAWNTTVMNIAGNLASGKVSLQSVGTNNPAG
jgi:hypothetical protein